MKSTSPGGPAGPFFHSTGGRPLLSLATNHRQAGIWVEQRSLSDKATIQSTRSVSTMFLRISPCPDWLLESDPLARTKAA
jgi:hypothetical protein